MAEFSAEPIHGSGPPSQAVDAFIATWKAVKLGAKVLIVVYAILGGVGSAYASFVLVSEVHHGGAWLFAFLVLDPIALASFVFLAVLIAPRSFFASWLASAFQRASVAAILVGLGVAAVFCWIVGFTAWELWKAR
jgi:hypothetical protein